MRGALALACVFVAMSCVPEIGERESLVTTARVVAVRAEPPEAKAGEPVRYTLVLATPDGPGDPSDATWATCASPKLLTENAAVSAACLRDDGVRAIDDRGGDVSAPVPTDACALFGPEVPPGGELRPHDPDATGGYYQPVRASVDGLTAFGFARLTCHLANASADVTADFAARYVRNQNPTLGALEATVDGIARPVNHLPRDRPARLRVTWADADAETYVVLDIASQTLETRREAMRVSWFVTRGTLAEDRTGRSETDRATDTSNLWAPPSSPGPAHVWIVLRDDRGGVAYEHVVLGVE